MKPGELVSPFPPLQSPLGPRASCQQPDGRLKKSVLEKEEVFAGRRMLVASPLKPVALTRAAVLPEGESQEGSRIAAFPGRIPTLK